MPFIAAQFYPRFYTMIPAGLAVGLGGGPLWCAKCTYLTVVSEAYASVSDLNADILVTRFFGLFFMFYQMAQVWGNLISSAGRTHSLYSKKISQSRRCVYIKEFRSIWRRLLSSSNRSRPYFPTATPPTFPHFANPHFTLRRAFLNFFLLYSPTFT